MDVNKQETIIYTFWLEVKIGCVNSKSPSKKRLLFEITDQCNILEVVIGNQAVLFQGMYDI